MWTPHQINTAMGGFRSLTYPILIVEGVSYTFSQLRIEFQTYERFKEGNLNLFLKKRQSSQQLNIFLNKTDQITSFHFQIYINLKKKYHYYITTQNHARENERYKVISSNEHSIFGSLEKCCIRKNINKEIFLLFSCFYYIFFNFVNFLCLFTSQYEFALCLCNFTPVL